MQDIRNIAIIAHVDHGKTTLVDKMMLAGHLFREGQNLSNQVLDSNDLERERGITILSKNVSINYKGTKINIIDTPGHSDFGGEVERVLNMADGCILLVDAFEGPMPQTRFVLQKALEIGLKPIVVVNKVDKPNCRPEEVYEMVFDLMFALNANEDQLDFPVVYGSAKNGWMGEDYSQPTNDITYLLDKIVEVIPAPHQLEGTPQMLITSLDYSSYTGRIAVGRVHRGTLTGGMNITISHRDGTLEKTRIKELHTFEGMTHVKTDSVEYATTKVRRPCQQSQSTNQQCRCCSQSTTRHSSEKKVSSAHQDTSTTVCKRNWRRTSHCELNLTKIPQTHGLSADAECCTCPFSSKQCVARATNWKLVSRR